MSIPTKALTGTHRITFTYVNKGRNFELAREFLFDVVNDGSWKDTSVADALRGRGRTVAVLQQGMPCRELGTENYAGAGDTYLHATHNVADRNSDFVNYGSIPVLYAGSYGQEARSLLRFDLAGVPKNAVVAEACLQVYLYGWGGGRSGKASFEAYEVLKPWAAGRGESLYVKDKVLPGEASWKCNQHPTPWAKPGADAPDTDRAGAAMSTFDVAGKTKLWVTLKLDPAVVGRWIAEPGRNNGVLLVGRGGQGNFRSAEFEDPPFRPRLVIGFSSGVKASGGASAPRPKLGSAPAAAPKPAAKPAAPAISVKDLPPGHALLHLSSGQTLVVKNLKPCGTRVCYETTDGKQHSVGFSSVKKIERP